MTPSQLEARRIQSELNRLSRGEVREVKLGRRTLKRGTVVTITGERGRFVFHSAIVKEGECKSICVFGGPPNREHWRHFRPDRLGVVKRTHGA